MTRRLLLLPLLLAACAPAPAGAPAAGGPTPPAATLAPPPSPFGPAVDYGSDKVPPGSFVFFEDFERGFDRWAMPDPKAQVAFRPLNALACGGLWTIMLGPEGGAEFTPAPGEHVLALKAPLDLTKARAPFLKYDVKGESSPAEALDLVAEIRGTDGAWTPVGRRVRGGYVFMASIGADLTAWAGQPVGLRFRATFAPGAGPMKGFMLDDVQVIEPR